MYRWHESLQLIQCPKQQVNLLTEVVYNVRFNFIPNESRMVKPYQAPWMTKTIKVFLRKKDRAYESFVRNGQPKDRHDEIQHMISEGSKMVEDAKQR